MKLLIDENVRGAIIRGLLRRRPDIDLVRVPDVGLSGVDDPAILEWAASENRLVLTHDAATLIGFAYTRVATGERMPGIIEAKQEIAISVILDDLLLLIAASYEGEWEGQILYLPLR